MESTWNEHRVYSICDLSRLFLPQVNLLTYRPFRLPRHSYMLYGTAQFYLNTQTRIGRLRIKSAR